MNITYSKQFIKSFEFLDKNLQKRIRTGLLKLPDGNIKKLKGNYTPPLFRLRIGKYRVLFEMNDDNIFVIDVDTRGDVYKVI